MSTSSLSVATSFADTLRYPAAGLVAFGQSLLVKSGLRDDMARDVATILVEGDLLGHNTHGLALLPAYLAEIDKGTMAKSGEPEIVNSAPASQAWDGKRLPGPWLTLRALDAAMGMAKSCGTGTVVIRRSHHIACLAAYLTRATDQGMMALIYCSDPSTKSVAPFGGVSSVFTPNPFAAGIPTTGDPILLDISASYTTNGMTGRLHKAGQKLAHPWVQDAQGNATNDPAVLFDQPAGTLLPLGGLEAGHKGYALALLVEALTAGLSGFGRADPSEGWGATVFVQVIDPAAMGGTAAYTRQMDWLVGACHDATPRPGVERVRLPGENGMKRRRDQQQNGVALFPSIVPALQPWADKLGCPLPLPK